jgi:hypothetical protein
VQVHGGLSCVRLARLSWTVALRRRRDLPTSSSGVPARTQGERRRRRDD